jgi:TRAP-type C4-dicarboxylate transport system permease small subunit
MFTDQLYRAAFGLAALFLATIGLLTLTSIFARLLGIFLPIDAEVSGFAMAASTFLALPWTFKSGDHIRVSVVLQRMQPRLRFFTEVWCLLFALFCIGLLAYSTFNMVIESYEINDLSTGIVPIPLWIPQASMLLGVCLLCVALLEILLRVVLTKSIEATEDSQNIEIRIVE